jgi:hypothetical protein
LKLHGAVVVFVLVFDLALAGLPRIALAVKLLIGLKECDRLFRLMLGSWFCMA